MNTIRLRLNVLGIGLNRNQIKSVLDPNDDSVRKEREGLDNFFGVAVSRFDEALLERYVKADEKMSRISAGTSESDIHNLLINTLASAKRSYTYGEFLACIELCALHGEMIANYLCVINKEVLYSNATKEKLSSEDQNSINKYQKAKFFSNRINQQFRINWLRIGNIISEKDKKNLTDVHKLRRKYFHHWAPHSDPESDSLDVLYKTSLVSSKYLELYKNQENIKKVEQYMRIISDER